MAIRQPVTNFDWINWREQNEGLSFQGLVGGDIVCLLREASNEALRRALSSLVALHESTGPRRHLALPRIFISHRQADEKRARVFARIAMRRRFAFWLDVLDPHLIWITNHPSSDPVRQALAIAIQIEFALLNCTHVLAVITPHTVGSMWVPYEYGRVKCATMFSFEATAWLSQAVQRTNTYAEYLRLGVVHQSRRAVKDWMDLQLRRWHAPTP